MIEDISRPLPLCNWNDRLFCSARVKCVPLGQSVNVASQETFESAFHAFHSLRELDMCLFVMSYWLIFRFVDFIWMTRHRPLALPTIRRRKIWSMSGTERRRRRRKCKQIQLADNWSMIEFRVVRFFSSRIEFGREQRRAPTNCSAAELSVARRRRWQTRVRRNFEQRKWHYFVCLLLSNASKRVERQEYIEENIRKWWMISLIDEQQIVRAFCPNYFILRSSVDQRGMRVSVEIL